MQQFTVPQFIDVEDKILGPISVRQFLIMLGGGLFAFVAYKVADFALFIVVDNDYFKVKIAFIFIN